MRPEFISLRDNNIFKKHLSLAPHELCVYAFENIYIWKKLYDISWALIKGNLCLFFKDKTGCFMYLPPLGKRVDREVIDKVFEMMDEFNKNEEISRIENIEEKDAAFYKKLGLSLKVKSQDYICLRQDLAQLKGNKFKSKRSSYNYFIKHYDCTFEPFILKYREECLRLFKDWSLQRRINLKDDVYQGMIEDSLTCLKIILEDYKALGLEGRIVRIEKKVRAFSFGYALNKDTFCILYEITDLSIKGLAQFIFREFCARIEEYKYINIMDDSGLENLKKVKLSYHPLRLVAAYIASRKR